MAYTLPQVFQMRKDVQAEYNKQPSATRDTWLRNWWTQYGQKEAVDMWNKDNAKSVSSAPVVNKPFENKPVVNNNFVQNQDNMQNAGSYQENTTPDTGDSAINNAINQLNQIGDEKAKNYAQIITEIINTYAEMTKGGQTINPDIEITPEKASEFLTFAQGKIDPYYQGQLRLSREQLLRESGWNSDEIAQNEAKIEKQYGQSLRQLSSNMADAGFSLSGERKLQEQNLASDTQSTIDSARKAAEYNAGNSARQFASEWGGQDIPQFNYGVAPKVQAGSEKFSRSLDTKPFYSISDSVLNGLQGSRTLDQEAATKAVAKQKEEEYKTTEANRIRSLNM